MLIATCKVITFSASKHLNNVNGHVGATGATEKGFHSFLQFPCSRGHGGGGVLEWIPGKYENMSVLEKACASFINIACLQWNKSHHIQQDLCISMCAGNSSPHCQYPCGKTTDVFSKIGQSFQENVNESY